MDIAGERQPLLDIDRNRHDCAFKTGSLTRSSQPASPILQYHSHLEETPAVYSKEGRHPHTIQKGTGGSPLPPVAEVVQTEPDSPKSTTSAGGISSTTATTSADLMGVGTGTGTVTPTTIPATFSPVPGAFREGEKGASSSAAAPTTISDHQPSVAGAESKPDRLERLDGVVSSQGVDEVMSPAPSAGSSQKKKKKKKSSK